jgi:quercetin dioxygenase-like cupin family protein
MKKKSPPSRTRKPAGRALDLSRSIEYRTGSVVSKTLVKKRAGSVTLFGFDKGQELSEHTAPFEAMVQVLSGEAEITVAGRQYHTCAGEAVLMPAGVPHALRAVKPFKMLLTMIKE